jgi:hypothetical protein
VTSAAVSKDEAVHACERASRDAVDAKPIAHAGRRLGHRRHAR